LRDPKLKDEDGALQRFDMIVANPPFSLKNWGRAAWADDPFGRADFGVPPESYGDFAFVEHMLASMNQESGRLAVVMPRGVLFRGGAEQAIRAALMEAGVLEAVIGLPGNLFYNTTIPACVLLCRAGRSAQDPVLFVDGGGRFIKGANKNELSTEDVNAVLAAMTSRQDFDGVHVEQVSPEAIAASGYDLNIGRYVRRHDDAEVDLEAAVAGALAARAALREADEALDKMLAAEGML
jgi:type I restriction enzyme M protein